LTLEEGGGFDASGKLIGDKLAVPLVKSLYVIIGHSSPVWLPFLDGLLSHDQVITASYSPHSSSVSVGVTLVLSSRQSPLTFAPGTNGLQEWLSLLNDFAGGHVDHTSANISSALFDFANTALTVGVGDFDPFDGDHGWASNASDLEFAVGANADQWIFRSLAALSAKAQAFAVVLEEASDAFSAFLFAGLATVEQAVGAIERPCCDLGNWFARALSGLMHLALFPHDVVWWAASGRAFKASFKEVLAASALFGKGRASVGWFVDV